MKFQNVKKIVWKLITSTSLYFILVIKISEPNLSTFISSAIVRFITFVNKCINFSSHCHWNVNKTKRFPFYLYTNLIFYSLNSLKRNEKKKFKLGRASERKIKMKHINKKQYAVYMYLRYKPYKCSVKKINKAVNRRYCKHRKKK